MEILHLYDDDEAPDISIGVSTFLGAASLIADEKTAPSERRGYIGGSDAPVVAGLSPWKTPYQLWLEKTGEEPEADLSANERVYWGVVLEEIVAKEYAKRNGVKIRRVNKLLKHPEYDWMGAHIDRDILNSDRILEVKTTSRTEDWGEENTDAIPDHYFAQVQHYLAVTGAAACDVAVLMFGQTYRQYTVERDEGFIAGLIEIEKDFWQHVIDGIPPTPETSYDANTMWPISNEGIVQGNEATLLVAGKLADVQARLKELEGESEGLVTELKKEMADIGDTLVFNSRKIATWKTQTSRQFDSKAFSKDYPDLYDQYKSESITRVFRFSYKPE